VVEALILETTFLIDLERERHRRRPGKAAAFLELHENARLYLTFTIEEGEVYTFGAVTIESDGRDIRVRTTLRR